MSQPDFRQRADANGAEPYGVPERDTWTASSGIGMPGADTRRYPEWHDGYALREGRGGWDETSESGPPSGWLEEGVYMPAPDAGGPPWDDPSPAVRKPRHSRARRRPGWPIVAAALLLLCVTTIMLVILSRGHMIRFSPTDNPAGTASQPPISVTAGAGNRGKGRTGRSHPAAPPPAITKAEAERVLSAYWHENNITNELRSDTLLGTIEGGSSYQMDAGTYRIDRVTDPANHDYVAFMAEDALYYIPHQASGVYPRWFVVRVTYASLASPQRATGAGYVLFAEASRGAAWKNVLEPYLLTASDQAPFIQTDAQGYAIQATPDATNLSVSPGQIAERTAESLDGASATVRNPANLADVQDEAYFQSRLPAGSTDTDKHHVSGHVFGLKTVGGGVLMFYSLTAQLSLAPPTGETVQLSIPGYYSSSQPLASAHLGYVDQFATYTPAGDGSPQVVADASGIAG